MENKDFNLSKIWQNQRTISSDFQGLLDKINLYKKEGVRKKWLGNITLSITMVILITIWILYDSNSIFPKLGLSFILFAIVLSLFKTNRFYNIFQKLDKGLSNQEYLNVLLEIQRKQKALQTKFMNLYFILLSVGIIIYLYEFSTRMTKTYAILAYGLSLAWIAFVWLFLKPKINKKQDLKINQHIESIQKIINSN